MRMERFARIRVGALGSIEFPVGYYFYVGKAARNLRQRITRHLTGGRREWWHIDYFRRSAVPAAALVASSGCECALAAAIASLPGAARIPRFGSSDCRCPGHLVHFRSISGVLATLTGKMGLVALKIVNLGEGSATEYRQ